MKQITVCIYVFRRFMNWMHISPLNLANSAFTNKISFCNNWININQNMYKLIFLNKTTNIIRILAYKRSFLLRYLYLLIMQSYFISKKFLQTIMEGNNKRSIKINCSSLLSSDSILRLPPIYRSPFWINS